MEALDLIKDNLIICGLLLGLYLVFWFSNTCLGAYLSVKVKKLDFNWEKIKEGTLKAFMLLLGLGSLVVGVSTIATIFNIAGIVDISKEIIDGVGMIVISTLMGWGIINYGKQCVEKVSMIFKKE